jgi:hypothetical protein
MRSVWDMSGFLPCDRWRGGAVFVCGASARWR